MTYHARLEMVNDRVGLLAMASIFCVTTTGAVILRFYARRLNRAPLGTDDWLALASIILVSALNGIFLAGTAQGAITGHSPVVDNWPISTELEHLVEKYKYAFQMTEKVAFGLIKLSILFLWKRIFGHVGSFSVVCWATIVFVIAWSISFFFATVFQCGTHWSWNWAPITLFLTQCTNSLDMLTVFCVTDLLSDFVIMSMPLPIIMKLQMPTKKKLGVTCLFLVGLLTIGAGIARMYIYLTTSYDKEDNPDFIADFTLFILWSDIEVNVGMMVCCMPTFIPVVGKCRDTVLYLARSSRLSKWSLVYPEKIEKQRLHNWYGRSEDSSLDDLVHKRNYRPRKPRFVAHDTIGTKTTAGLAPRDDDIEAQLQSNAGILARTEISNTLD